MKHVKEGVLFTPCSPVLIDGIVTTAGIFHECGVALVITSGTEGIHPAGGEYDPHYLGYAVDLRTRHLDAHTLSLLIPKLRAALGNNWKVVLEPDHLHVQCQSFIQERERRQRDLT